MSYAVTHVLIPMILVDLVRDHLLKKKKRLLPNKYILVAGLSGLLPDVDLIFSYLTGEPEFHRTLTHAIWFPVAFFSLFMIFYFYKKKDLYKTFLMVFIGVSLHIILDFSTFGTVSLFYPLASETYGLNIVPVPASQVSFIYSAIDAVILFLWLVHEELEHKISDYF